MIVSVELLVCGGVRAVNFGFGFFIMCRLDNGIDLGRHFDIFVLTGCPGSII